MTLDEAIRHAEEVAEEKENEAQNLEYSKLDWKHEANQCSECAEEHRQLAEWLKDYKRLLESSSEIKIDCDNADCNNCVNHKYCDYESNNSEIPTGSTTKNNLAVEDEERTLALLYLEQIKEDYIEGEGYERHPLPEYYAIEKAIKTLAMPSVTPQKTKTENDFAVDPIDRVELLRAMDTWDKFGFTTRYGLERLDKDDKGFVPYVKYDDMLKCVKGMSSVTLQEPRWIPVSERLPEDSGEYLVSVTDKEDEDYKQVGVAWFAHPKDYDIQDGEWRELMIDEIVVAWMPKPKAYSEVEE